MKVQFSTIRPSGTLNVGYSQKFLSYHLNYNNAHIKNVNSISLHFREAGSSTTSVCGIALQQPFPFLLLFPRSTSVLLVLRFPPVLTVMFFLMMLSLPPFSKSTHSTFLCLLSPHSSLSKIPFQLDTTYLSLTFCYQNHSGFSL